MGKQCVRIVVDSTADLPAAVAAALGIAVVPLVVHFGSEALRDGVDIDQATFVYRLQHGGQTPTTSQPAPGDFLATYQQAHADGLAVVSIHIADRLSGTVGSAQLAAEQARAADASVTIIDSGTTTMALGLVALEAAVAARAGATAAEIGDLVASLLPRVHLVAALDTLEYLRRGGRIGLAKSLLGSLLSIKPLISVRDGVVVPLEQVRTRQRALERVRQRLDELAPRGFRRIAVIHVDDPEGASLLAQAAGEYVPADRWLIADVGPVIATHTGPKCFGFAAITEQ